MSSQSSIMRAVSEPFQAFMESRLQKGHPSTDEILDIVMPLFCQVKATHEKGRVAPLAGLDALQVHNETCWFSESATQPPQLNAAKLSRIEKEESRALEVTGHEDIRSEADGSRQVTNLDIGQRGKPIERPVYLPGYVSWEHEIEHHDQLTDIYSLGMLTASIAFGLDLAEEEDLEKFVAFRSNLFQINPNLHPVMAKAIMRMTELRRSRRVQDMPSLIDTLTHYRLQIAAPDLDFRRIPGFKEAAHKERQKIIQQRLRDRLFEISRRNRLLYFRSTLQMLNLTVGSVPLMLEYKRISPDALCTWQGEFARAISQGETVQLGKYLRFEDAPYLPSVLDQIRNQEARDRNEYGFSQLRLVIAFLRWHNLKEVKEERIVSPLVLLPVSLEKKKGVRDSYTITPLSNEAEINPILRYHLRQVYGLQLPEFIDLSVTDLKAFHELLQKQIQASEPGITLRVLERPQIKLIHERARARLELFRRRKRLTGKGVQTLEGVDYSYSRQNFQPLGLQLFLKRVRPSPAPLHTMAGGDPRRRGPSNMVSTPEPPAGPEGVATPPDSTKSDDTVEEALPPGVREKNMFTLQQETESNPFTWDFDLCSLTLGNFNYRKMSLVRDYTTLLDGHYPNPAFDSIFPEAPRAVDHRELLPLPPEEGYLIVDSDPTQMAAITRARSGASYIIQGPPGTGKSQTITNLIADYVARGKRVLFVCAKRAAIDVVYYRLKQRGLDSLCSLIHDSQGDKKAFIQDLKTTYEDYLARPARLQEIQTEREQVAKQLRFDLDTLQRFSTAMAHVDPHDGVPLRGIYSRLIELSASLPAVDDLDAEKLPGYTVWARFSRSIHTLGRILNESRGDPILAHTGLRHLSGAVLAADRPLEAITQALDQAVAPLQELLELPASCGLPADTCNSITDWSVLVQYAAELKPLADLGHLPLLNSLDPTMERLRQALRQRQKLCKHLEAATGKNEGWVEKIPAADLPATLDLAAGCENSFFRFLMPSFWRLRKLLRARYQFSAHVVAPTWTRMLKDLQAEYDAADALKQAIEEQTTGFRTEDIGDLLKRAETLHAKESSLSKPQRALRERLLMPGTPPNLVVKMLGAGPLVQSLTRVLEPLLADCTHRNLTRVADDMASVREALPVLPEVLPVLTDLLTGPPDFTRALAEREWTPDAFEGGLLSAAILRAYRRDRSLPRMTGRTLGDSVDRIKTNYRRWMEINAQLIRERVHAGFLNKVGQSNLATGQIAPSQKELKRVYTKGRRELEHEFGKVMRYRSIRDLSDDETGVVVADLKPIWLMSPLSVSDTLPMQGANFDVVIYDEASQIPLEESIPALYRAAQIIVVGDEKQLPPTDFFASKSSEEDEDPADADDAESFSFELNADSFLTQSVENLPSTMLRWHYRSRSEALISFSNAAFYERKLLTIPDAHLHPATAPIVATDVGVGDANAAHVLDRPVSFHYLPQGMYADRRNADEAQYIARLVRGLLVAKTGRSIGIVAFSEAQQGEIESALNALADADAVFAELLEAEREREENDQFCGLFVKNLENVQGDERDIILMSVCYGYDAHKKMLMNFGPINKSGGEKRLNVVFSRAKCHMALVSSIRSTAITNEYNDGANCLKRYIAYADALSSGQIEQASRILGSFQVDQRRATDLPPPDGLAMALAAALRERGYEVAHAVGQSDFRCDLAVKKSSEQRYRLGILIDHPAQTAPTSAPDTLPASTGGPAPANSSPSTAAGTRAAAVSISPGSYAPTNNPKSTAAAITATTAPPVGNIMAALEDNVLRPTVLTAFGWQVTKIYAKDWHHDRLAVVANLEALLTQNSNPVADQLAIPDNENPTR